MERVDLIKRLNICKPALATKDLIPIFTHFCFTEENTVFAYNDIVGVEMDCDVDFIGAVDGSSLLGQLENSVDKEVMFKESKDGIAVSCGKSKYKWNVLGADNFVFEVPDTKKAEKLEVNDDFFKGLDLCAKTSSSDESQPTLMGVTVELDVDSYLYSSDMMTISRYRILEDQNFKKSSSYILPTDFCAAVVNMKKELTELPEIFITDKFIVAYFGDNLVLGRLIIPDDDLDFAEMISNSMDETDLDHMVKVPGAIERALKRVINGIRSDNEPKAFMTVKKKSIHFDLDRHNVTSADPVPYKGGHPEIQVAVNPNLIERGVSLGTEFCVNESCVVLRDGDTFTHLIANVKDSFTE